MFSDMGNEFGGSVCGESRWNIPATTPFDSFSPCFTTASTADLETLGSDWDIKGILPQCAAADDSDSGCNADSYFMDSNLPMNVDAPQDWTQTINLINSGSGGGGDGEGNYPSQILLQDHQMNSRLNPQDPWLKPFNLTTPSAFVLDQIINTPNTTYGYSQQQQSVMAYHPGPASTSTPNFSTSSSCLTPHDHPNSFQRPEYDQLSIFSDQAPPMWRINTSSTNFLMDNSSESDHLEASTSTTKCKKKKSHSPEQPLLSKRPRIETPSPLPTFKVRKEKMGDRITALQQLVSPFGKTDTASVLHEAIDYIKFLHSQVNALCNPYLKNGNLTQHQQMNEKMMKKLAAKKVDLKSRGLCVVPISSTFPVASETTADFWTPTTFGGAFTR